MIEEKKFGKLPDGREVTLFRISNRHNEWVELLDFGASLHSIFVKDKYGNIDDVIMGASDASELGKFAPEGITIGRCANRIAFGRYELNGIVVQLETNVGDHQLHSASGCYGQKMFTANVDQENNCVRFYLKDTGEGGFDCNADVIVQFSFNDDHQLEIMYEITPDGDTVINPTNHAYFNLSGSGDVRNHHLQIFAKDYAPKAEIGMPIGAVEKVEGSPLDFRNMTTLRDAFNTNSDFFIPDRKMYDDCFILTDEAYGPAAKLYSSESGRVMTVLTDMPAMVLFTPTFPLSRKGEIISGYSSVCLETQFVTNAVNCPEYKSPICKAGKTFTSKTVFEFSICKSFQGVCS